MAPFDPALRGSLSVRHACSHNRLYGLVHFLQMMCCTRAASHADSLQQRQWMNRERPDPDNDHGTGQQQTNRS